MPNPQTVEYYLVAEDGRYMRFDWDGPDPSFVMLAPLGEALTELGAFDTDPVPAWPAQVGTPYFLVPAHLSAPMAEVFADTPWSDYLTPPRIAAALDISTRHAAELVELALAESERVTELLRVAAGNGAGLLCVVY